MHNCNIKMLRYSLHCAHFVVLLVSILISAVVGNNITHEFVSIIINATAQYQS